MTTTIASTKTMSREELIADEVEAIVARWGECERVGARRQARGIGTGQLRFNAAERRGSKSRGRLTTHIARGCLDEGAS